MAVQEYSHVSHADK